MTYTAPEPLPIAASFERTWAAVIDRFAAGNVPIRTVEKASGIIVAEPLSVTAESSRRYADCGSGLMAPLATRASYNVRVSGDSARSTVRVTATFGSQVQVGAVASGPVSCSSRGEFEKEFASAIKAAAEKR